MAFTGRMMDPGNGRIKGWLALPAALLLLVVCGAVMAQDPPDQALELVRAAKSWVGRECRYDGSYVVISYPGGDPGEGKGGCTDLVIRSYRAIGLDLQVLVHEDMEKNFDDYPAKDLYLQTEPDTNIDHRRTPNLQAFFKRHGQSLTISIAPDDLKEWRPGDIVIFDLLANGIPSHVGVISDRVGPSGRPLVINHFPPKPTEDDCLAKWKIVGHYRYFPEQPGEQECSQD